MDKLSAPAATQVVCRLTAATSVVVLCFIAMLALLWPTGARAQAMGPVEAGTSLDGTRLTYYPRNNGNQCQADCANNPNCRGYTWIQGGTYAASDAAMCYLLSAVTRRAAARGHYSAVKVATVGTTPAGFVGCFRDTPAFDLNGSLVRSRANTPSACVAACGQKGFAYAGVQYGESCLCGNSYGRYGRAENCNMRCTGDSGQICGGYNANSVYATGVAGGTTTGGTTPGGTTTGGTTTGGTTTDGTTGGTNVVNAASLAGMWQWAACNDKYGLLIGFSATGAATFEGAFENGNGNIKNGRVNGNQLSFTRVIYGDQVQDYWGTITNEGGRLKIVNGGWKGSHAGNCPGALNWHAEKR